MLFPDDDDQDDPARLAALLQVYVQIRELFIRLEFYDSRYVNWSMEQLGSKTVEIYGTNKKPPG